MPIISAVLDYLTRSKFVDTGTASSTQSFHQPASTTVRASLASDEKMVVAKPCDKEPSDFKSSPLEGRSLRNRTVAVDMVVKKRTRPVRVIKTSRKRKILGSNTVSQVIDPESIASGVDKVSSKERQRSPSPGVVPASPKVAQVAPEVSQLCQVVPTSSYKEESASGMSDVSSVNGAEYTSIEQDVGSVLTQAMVEEEKACHTTFEQEQEKEREKTIKEWDSMLEHQRFARLQHLLDKSNVFCQFLLQRMDEQKAEELRKHEKQAKKEEKEKENESRNVQPKQILPLRETRARGAKKTPPTTPQVQQRRSGRKRKADVSSYKIEDYVDKQALTKRRKLETTEGNESQSSCSESQSSQEQQVPCSPQLASLKCSTPSPVTSFKGKSPKPSPAPRPVGQSKLLSGGTLRPYQIDGINWLKVLYENGVNGILADEMGLGKTIQCIGLIAHLVEMGVKGPYLVAAPLSTLPNWLSEFKRFAPKIPVVLYHGSADERAKLRRKLNKLKSVDEYTSYPTVITSYEICMRDQRHIYNLMWKYIIVDEGHRIKNLNCRLIKELKTYQSANRLLLTGTPLQNNLAELWSLLNFLLPDIFDDLNSFQRWFDFSAINEEGGNKKIIAQEQEHQVLERLHAILTPFLLRRLKTDVELELPPKKEVVVYAPLTKHQQTFYRTTLDRTILDIVGDTKDAKKESVELTASGRPKRKSRVNVNYKMFDDDKIDLESLMKHMLEEEAKRTKSLCCDKGPKKAEVTIKLNNILMQLRKCCNHPYLLEYPLDSATMQYRVDEDVVRTSGKMVVLDQLLPELKKRGHKVLLFSQMTKMLDIVEDYCYLRKYQFSRLDGSMSISARQEQIEAFNTDPDVLLFLLSTRAGGLGLNLSSADTVIIYDSDWNPQVDLQAQDRSHRIGQTKPVVIYRFITANSVDQKIVERAASKRKLEKMVIHKGKFKGKQVSGGVSATELLDLLESTDHDEIMKNEGILSRKDLEQLLDRSDMTTKGGKQSTPSSQERNRDSTTFKVVEVSS